MKKKRCRLVAALAPASAQPAKREAAKVDMRLIRSRQPSSDCNFGYVKLYGFSRDASIVLKTFRTFCGPGDVR